MARGDNDIIQNRRSKIHKITWSLERPSLTILFMSNSLGSSGLNSGSNLASSESSSDMARTDLLFIDWMRFRHGAWILELKLKAETVAMKASNRIAKNCILNNSTLQITTKDACNDIQISMYDWYCSRRCGCWGCVMQHPSQETDVL